jgi:hypothetical protein
MIRHSFMTGFARGMGLILLGVFSLGGVIAPVVHQVAHDQAAHAASSAHAESCTADDALALTDRDREVAPPHPCPLCEGLVVYTGMDRGIADLEAPQSGLFVEPEDLLAISDLQRRSARAPPIA